ncbi:hypothetical protein THRCLA_12046 [Thraustotheca clavata]|uniref:Uncharacterized protein n=1 Tax=Thraustotheca clavata TaxID=74557 RepID=A0A1V9Y423_9STRA|nr:hypothetical protein THRCLA_12046 [Thraustotheca clavata]
MEYHVIQIKGKRWLSCLESSDTAMLQLNKLFNVVLELLTYSCAQDEHGIMRECSHFLLEWFRAGYVKFTPSSYLNVLTALCATGSNKVVIDATHTLNIAMANKLLRPALWLQLPTNLNLFVSGLAHPSASTVEKCASSLSLILGFAEHGMKENLFVLFTPPSLAKIHWAFYHWRDTYSVSHALERISCFQASSQAARLPRNFSHE